MSGRTPVQLGWSLSDLAGELGGVLVGSDASIDVVSTDSRSTPSGALFVALVGERFDGHDYAAAAMDAGAVAVLVEGGRDVGTEPRIEVPNTIEALLGLAGKRRAELTMPVVAITGSTGKTSTKDLLAAAIPGAWASPRSFNNEIGVPLTVLATPSDATALVVEVGSRGPGHIRWLTTAVRPDVAVVTNLGVVHMETFGTEQGLADAKYELIEMLGEDGVAVIPADEARLARGPSPRTLTFGGQGSDVVVGGVDLDRSGFPTFTVKASGRAYRTSLRVAGAHQALNAAAALAAGIALGWGVDELLRGMSTAEGSQWRMDIHPGEITIVNDAYNANPQSVEAALRTIARMEGNRKIAVLGPMAELGHVCEIEHERMGRLAASLGLDVVLVVGPDHGYGLGAPGITVNATDFTSAADTLHAVAEPGDVVLVKASRAAALERLARTLIEDQMT